MARVTIVGEDGQPFDLSQAQPWDGESNGVPPGTYIFDIAGAAQEMSNNGKPQLVLDLIVVAGDGTEAYNGAKQKHWVPLTAKAAGRLKNLLDAVGLAVGPEGFDDQDLLGRQFQADVVEEQYEEMSPTGPVPKTSRKIKHEVPVAGSETPAQASTSTAAPAPAPAPAAAAPAQPARPATPPAKPAAPVAAAAPRVKSTLPRPGQLVVKR